MSKPWDGSGAESVVLDRTETAEFVEGPPGGWSAIRTYGARDILIVPTDSIASATPRPFVTGPANETDVALSPSGKLMAYQSDETGRQEIYMRPVPGPGPRVPVSVDGGTAPVWSPDGNTIYFRSATHVMAAKISEQPALAVTRRDSLFQVNLVEEGLNLSVMPGGRGFVVATGQLTRVGPSLNRIAVVTNWQSLFAKSAAGSK
jgi:serine/threonine-protein kinase